jgi:hypothetical protein
VVTVVAALITPAGLRREQIDAALIVTSKELVGRIERWQDAGIDRMVLSRRGAVDLPSLAFAATRSRRGSGAHDLHREFRII